jgi:hypothetical protein
MTDTVYYCRPCFVEQAQPEHLGSSQLGKERTAAFV